MVENAYTRLLMILGYLKYCDELFMSSIGYFQGVFKDNPRYFLSTFLLSIIGRK
jgi:hypothetical protein